MIEFLLKYKYPFLFAGWFLLIEGGMKFYEKFGKNPDKTTMFIYGFMIFTGIFIVGFYTLLARKG